jgi:hypothetical protein
MRCSTVCTPGTTDSIGSLVSYEVRLGFETLTCTGPPKLSCPAWNKSAAHAALWELTLTVAGSGLQNGLLAKCWQIVSAFIKGAALTGGAAVGSGVAV